VASLRRRKVEDCGFLIKKYSLKFVEFSKPSSSQQNKKKRSKKTRKSFVVARAELFNFSPSFASKVIVHQ
jgi:hypothetical protein